MRSWFRESPTSNKFESESRTISQKLGLKCGDVVWVGQRKRTHEGGWTSLGRLRAHFINLAERSGFPWTILLILTSDEMQVCSMTSHAHSFFGSPSSLYLRGQTKTKMFYQRVAGVAHITHLLHPSWRTFQPFSRVDLRRCVSVCSVTRCM